MSMKHIIEPWDQGYVAPEFRLVPSVNTIEYYDEHRQSDLRAELRRIPSKNERYIKMCKDNNIPCDPEELIKNSELESDHLKLVYDAERLTILRLVGLKQFEVSFVRLPIVYDAGGLYSMSNSKSQERFKKFTDETVEYHGTTVDPHYIQPVVTLGKSFFNEREGISPLSTDDVSNAVMENILSYRSRTEDSDLYIRSLTNFQVMYDDENNKTILMGTLYYNWQEVLT